LGFENNAGQPLLQSGVFVNVTHDILKLQKHMQQIQLQMIANSRIRSTTPEKVVKSGIMNPE
jgi:hypothetical protein